MPPRVLAIFVLCLSPLGLAAQVPGRSVPLLSADFLIGMAKNPDHVGEVWYHDTKLLTARIAGTLRLGPRGRVRPVLTVDRSPTVEMGDDILICDPAPNMTCRRHFPSYTGMSLGLGLRALVGGYLTFGVGVGTAFYDRRGTYLEGEFVGQPGRHIGVVINFRHVELHTSGGARMWVRPVTIGLRLQ